MVPIDAGLSPFAAFRIRFMRAVGAVMTLAALLITGGLFISGAPATYVGLLAVGAVIATSAFFLAARGRGDRAVQLVTYGVTALAAVYLIVVDQLVFVPVAVEVLYVLAIFSAFLTASRDNLAWGISVMVILTATMLWRAQRIADDRVLSIGLTDVIHFALLWVAATQVNKHLRESRASLAQRLRDIDVVVDHARSVAVGDLTRDVATKDAEVARVIDDMLSGLREMVGRVQEGVRVLATTATNIDSMATQQQRGALNQSSAVSETRETIQSLAAASRRIHESAEGVVANAQSTQETNERANTQLNALAQHTRRIDELLELVKDIASKSEILALNAALEGTRAGEAGRGFSLVAAQMQRLAEDTAGVIKDVKVLTTDITKSTSATVVSMEEATKLARDTTVAAQRISLITQQQSSGAEQVLEAMNDVASVTQEFADSAKEATLAIQEVKALSEVMSESVDRFRI